MPERDEHPEDHAPDTAAGGEQAGSANDRTPTGEAPEPPARAGFGHTNQHGYFFSAEDASDPGTVEVRPPSWGQLVADLLLFGSREPYWIYRGHASAEWSLTTRLLRDLEASRIPSDNWRFAEQTVTGFFKERARAFLDVVPSSSDTLGWLSLMQHYRAPTRLLDWSASPFVAAGHVPMIGGDSGPVTCVGHRAPRRSG